MGEMRVIGPDGDLKIIWDPENDDEVEAAREQFEKLLAKKEYRAYRVDKKGEKAREMKEFDPDAGKIIIAPLIQGG